LRLVNNMETYMFVLPEQLFVDREGNEDLHSDYDAAPKAGVTRAASEREAAVNAIYRTFRRRVGLFLAQLRQRGIAPSRFVEVYDVPMIFEPDGRPSPFYEQHKHQPDLLAVEIARRRGRGLPQDYLDEARELLKLARISRLSGVRE
jgi:hypothetical protein